MIILNLPFESRHRSRGCRKKRTVYCRSIFSRLGATLSLAEGRMTTTDLALTSTDVDLTATRTVTVATMATDFAGRAQLSEALSAEAGTDLRRYAQDGGRVTLPVTVTDRSKS